MSADLTGLHVDVSVTVVGDACAPDAVGHWDGTYWYGDGA
jgi:hypothetical protein